MKRLVEEVVSVYQRIDILVSNLTLRRPSTSGDNGSSPFPESPASRGNIFTPRPLAQLSWEDFSTMALGRIHSAFNITAAVLPVMEQQRYGRIVYISSEHANGPASPRMATNMLANGVSAAALNTYAKYVAVAEGQYGITANVVSPSMIEMESTVAFLPPEFKQRVAASTPLGRACTPRDVAHLVAFLADDHENSFITGAVVPLTGGLGIARSG